MVLLEDVAGGGAAREVDHSLIWHSVSKGNIITVQLRISLLNQHDPELLAMCVAKNRTVHGLTRYVVVDCDLHPLAILAKPNSIDPFAIALLCDEEVLDQLWSFRK